MIERPPLGSLGYDELIDEIERVGDRFRSGEDFTVDERVELFERGVLAVRRAKELLKDAHARVTREES